MKIATPRQVVSFWKKAGPKRWFKKDPAFDQKIREAFLVTHQAAAMEKLSAWEESAEGALALLLLLDQFPRNMFRGTTRAFDNDPQARAIARRAIKQGFDKKVPAEFQMFFYLPFEHSEELADQEACVKYVKAMKNKDLLHWAKIHHDIIKRFGRFPHRNEILNRRSTPEEVAFLEQGGFGG
ncbi:MAG TPA: DUF924 family protein [Xanthobacteraceae bacterium]|jgi:uncharacterized protein (DUF924 family)|nr:DUF924 family protein [Xanthobacteraceae bacterium]